MNDTQRKVLLLGVVGAVVAGLYAPWNYTFDARGIHSSKGAGYYFILDPPAPEEKDSPIYGVSLDTHRLLIEWAVIALVVTGLLLNLQGPRGNASRPSDKAQSVLDQSKPVEEDKHDQSLPPKHDTKSIGGFGAN